MIIISFFALTVHGRCVREWLDSSHLEVRGGSIDKKDKCVITNRIWQLVILLAGLIIVTPSLAQSSTKIVKRIKKVLRLVGPGAVVGVKVQDLTTNKTLYTKNANRLLIPASNFKLFTAVATLSYLGPNFHYRTQIFTDAKRIRKGKVRGNIYLKFSGDPSLTNEDLYGLIESLAKLGVKTIQGNVYIDDSVYQQKRFGRGWDQDDYPKCYSAPVVGDTLDRNCLKVTLTPARRVGRLAVINPKEVMRFTPLKNQIVTKRASRKQCKIDVRLTKQKEFALTGCIRKNTSARAISVAIKDPNVYVRSRIKKALKEQGIRVKGKIRHKNMLAKKRLLVTHHSLPLWQLNGRMMKYSNNLYAESMLKTLGAKYFRTIGTWNNGLLALIEILKKQAGIKLEKKHIFDGSGLSRKNLITANQMSKLLKYAYFDFSIGPEFLASLPIAGIDGTLRKRLRKTPLRGHLRAKTGSMNDISSLSGYLETQNHHIISFVIIVNGLAHHAGQYRAVQDRFCRALYKA